MKPKTMRVSGEAGISLVEALAGTVIAVITVIGLAYSFGTGRGLMNRYEIARVGLAAAQRRMEVLSSLPPTADSLGIPFPQNSVVYGPLPFNVGTLEAGTESWRVAWYNDPADDSGGDPDTFDLKRVTVTVAWNDDVPDSVQLSRLFSAR